jgi:hypothetical protein
MLGLLESLFSALDAPGAYTRGALSGQFGERVDGRGLLENWGVLGQNQDGLDFGDVLGFGAGVLTDPLTYASGGLGLLGKALGKGDDAARLLAGADVPPSLVGGWGAMDDLARTAPAGNLDQLALGYQPRPLLEGRRLFPDEALANTAAKDDFGNPLRLFHGSVHGPVQTPNPARWSDPESLLFGPGHYMTDNPEVASSYAKTGASFIRRRLSHDEIVAKYQPGQFVSDWGTDGLLVDSISPDNYGGLVVTGRPGKTGSPVSFRAYDEVYDRPNQAVSSYFLNSQKPFDMFSKSPLPDNELSPLVKALAETDPRGHLGVLGNAEDLSAFRLPPEQLYRRFEELTGKANINQALQKAGYDAIRHHGGVHAGGGKTLHDVWIALNPEQVYEPFLESQVRGKWL